MQFRYDILIEKIQANNLKVGVEVGVKRGQNIAKIVQACPDFLFHAVDPWDPKLQYYWWGKGAQQVNERFFNKVLQKYPKNIIKHKGYSLPVSAEFENESVDLIFLDGDHEYDGLKADIEAWLPKLRVGGFLAGHDYGHAKFPGMKKCVDDLFPNAEIYDDMVWLIQKI